MSPVNWIWIMWGDGYRKMDMSGLVWTFRRQCLTSHWRERQKVRFCLGTWVRFWDLDLVLLMEPSVSLCSGHFLDCRGVVADYPYSFLLRTV
ncbi:hypothetical protein NL676_034705 [Syzygium grande]|nr:hypothetical protein NL676_034705 [Syzygium grande]